MLERAVFRTRKLIVLAIFRAVVIIVQMLL